MRLRQDIGLADELTRPRRARARGRSSVPFDWPTAWQMARLVLNPRRAVTGRRAPWYAGVSLAWWAARLSVELGMKADDLIYPRHRDQPVVAPTFIFANARSGTALMHHLLSLDDERFVAPKLYQTILPAVTWNRLLARLGALDTALGGHMHAVVDFLNERFLSGWAGIHEIRLDSEEEDEPPWLYTLMSPTVTLLFPDVWRFARAEWLDRAPARVRARYLDYYETVIQRILFAAGGDRTYLNKNIMLASRARSVLERFPDARFIYLVRHPYDSLGSMLQMWYVGWEAHSPDLPKSSRESRAMGQLAIDFYKCALDLRKHLPEEQFMVVRFDDLVADPAATVERIYAHFNLTISPAYRARLEEATSGAGEFKSSGHHYTLEEFGLTRREIHRQLRPLFEEFGFEP